MEGRESIGMAKRGDYLPKWMVVIIGDLARGSADVLFVELFSFPTEPRERGEGFAEIEEFGGGNEPVLLYIPRDYESEMADTCHDPGIG